LAEKLLIDVFLDVWRNAASFDGRSSVSTWLLAIAKGSDRHDGASLMPNSRPPSLLRQTN
jgi:Sigma-70 region 2